MTKKDLGAFYTPKHTVNYIIDLLFGFDEKSKLLEPLNFSI
jgi:type I restriction-modification system DNA methylase subunit